MTAAEKKLRAQYLVNSGAVNLNVNGEFHVDWGLAVHDPEFKRTVKALSDIGKEFEQKRKQRRHLDEQPVEQAN